MNAECQLENVECGTGTSISATAARRENGPKRTGHMPVNGHMLCCNVVFTGTRKVKVDHHSIPMLYPYVLVV